MTRRSYLLFAGCYRTRRFVLGIATACLLGLALFSAPGFQLPAKATISGQPATSLPSPGAQSWGDDGAAGKGFTPNTPSPEFNTFSAWQTGCATASFLQAPQFSVGVNDPQSIAVGDFNADGKADVVIGDYAGGARGVTVLLGNGSGGFDAPTHFSTGTWVQAVAVGDFNQDNKLDIVAGIQSCCPNASVGILLGTGAGGFAAPVTAGLSNTNIAALATGDFNQDGMLDVAVADANGNRVRVLLGNGTGGLGAPADFGGGTAPSSLVVGDFNEDGKLDIATANRSSSNVWVRFGNGAGGFSLSIIVSAGSEPRGITTGDFNQDGRPDLATANNTSISILLNNGAGGFNTATSVSIAGIRLGAITSGDFNQDGKLDLAASGIGTGDNAIWIVAGNGTGGFGAPSGWGVGRSVFGVVAADFNQDGKFDLASLDDGGSSNPGSLSVFLNTGNARFVAGSDFNVSNRPFSVGAGDFNLDGKRDFVTGYHRSDGQTPLAEVAIFLGSGGGNFDPPTFVNLNWGESQGIAEVSAFVIADFNNDGKPDLAVSGAWFNSGRLSILIGNGAGGFSAPVQLDNSLIKRRDMVAGDFNSDGKLDLATGNWNSTVSLWLGNGLGGFAAPVNFACGTNVYEMATADFNQDNNLDLIVSGYTPNQAVAVLLGNGAGGMGAPNIFGMAGGRRVAVADFNLDGKMDAAVSRGDANNLTILQGNGTGGFNAATDYDLSISTGDSVVVGDFNLDNKPDVAVGTSDPLIIVLLNDGAGNLSVQNNFLAAYWPDNMLAADFNQDGRLDLLTANAINSVSLRLNTCTAPVPCPTITVSPIAQTLPAGTTGQNYSQTFMASGGASPYNFTVSAGALPGGLNLSAAGVLSGAPAAFGLFNFTVGVTDNNGCTGERAYTLTVNCPTITLSPANPALPPGIAGQSYSQAFGATGGALPYGFSVTAGALPPNVSLSAAGVLSGAPNQTGTFNFTVSATDNNGCTGERAYTLIISNCPEIIVNPSNPTLPPGMAGQNYNQTFSAMGGVSPYTFTVSAGALPAGLNLSAGGSLSGAPAAFGPFNFTVRATDNNGCTGERAYTLIINPPCGTITISPAPAGGPAVVMLPNGFIGTAYNQALTASGGASPYAFTVSAGTLPGGLSLSSSGLLSGTPSAIGAFNFTAKATDANGCMGTQAYTVAIGGSGLQFYPLPSPVRLLETRAGFSGCTNPGNPINANDTFTLPARTPCAGIPANAAAVTGNITVVPSGGGFLTLFPSTATQPQVANSNFAAGEITNNVFTVGLGAGDGAFKIFTNATTHIIADVTGYYAPPGTGGLYFHPLATPVRLLETRTGFSGCFAPGTPLTGTGDPNSNPNLDFEVQGRSPVAPPCNSIPASAQVLVGNATSVLPGGGGYLTIYPSGGTRPTVASSNYAGSDVINGPFAVKLGTDGKFKIYTFASTHLVVDILGYYSADATDANGAGLLFNPLPTPVRLLETRPDFPGFPLSGCTRTNAKIPGNLASATHTQSAGGFCGLPASAQAVVGNVSVVNSEGAGFLTLFPGNLTTAPLVATSNYPAPATFGYNRHYFVGLSPANGTFKVLTQFTTDLILDASGYFAP